LTGNIVKSILQNYGSALHQKNKNFVVAKMSKRRKSSKMFFEVCKFVCKTTKILKLNGDFFVKESQEETLEKI